MIQRRVDTGDKSVARNIECEVSGICYCEVMRLHGRSADVDHERLQLSGPVERVKFGGWRLTVDYHPQRL